MTAGVCVRNSAHLPSSPHPPSLVLLVPGTDTTWAIQHRRGGELLEEVPACQRLRVSSARPGAGR